MKKVFAREELCINCRLCEVYCKTAHSKSKDVLTANKFAEPAPVSKQARWLLSAICVRARICLRALKIALTERLYI